LNNHITSFHNWEYGSLLNSRWLVEAIRVHSSQQFFSELKLVKALNDLDFLRRIDHQLGISVSACSKLLVFLGLVFTSANILIITIASFLMRVLIVFLLLILLILFFTF